MFFRCICDCLLVLFLAVLAGSPSIGELRTVYLRYRSHKILSIYVLTLLNLKSSLDGDGYAKTKGFETVKVFLLLSKQLSVSAHPQTEPGLSRAFFPFNL